MVARKDELRERATRQYSDGASSDEIKRDIDRTRADMDETLNALGDRLHPRHLLDDLFEIFGGGDTRGAGTERARRAAQSAGRTMYRQIKQHPVPSLLIGAGLAYLLFEDEGEHPVRRGEPPMYSGSYVDARTGEPYDLGTYGEEEEAPSGGTTEKARETAGRAQEKLSGAGRSMRESVSGATARAGELAGQARSRAGEWSEGARHRAGRMRSQAGQMSAEAQRRMREGYARSRDRFEDAVEDYPLAVGLGCLALGALVGLALPRTRREDELMGEQSDQLKHQVRERGEEMVERGKQVAQSTASAVTEESEREGLSPSGLGEKLQHVAEKTLSAAEQAAHEEGIAPGDIKEKARHVAQHAKETAKQESKQQSGATEQHTAAQTHSP